MVQATDRLEIEGNPLYPALLTVTFAFLSAVVGAALLGLYDTDRIHNTADRAFALILAASFAALAIGQLRSAIALKGTTVTISPAGFVDRRMSTELIPWRAVSQMETLLINQPTYLAFRLTPAFCEQADRRAMRSLLFRFKTRFRHLSRHLMSNRNLEIEFNDLAQGMTSYRSAAIARMSDVDEAAMIPQPMDATSDILLDLKSKRPYLSIALLALLIAIYAGQVALTGSDGTVGRHFGELTLRSLILDGGLGRNLVDMGQYWRFFTAPLLHLNPLHLFGNGIALIFSGYLLERLIGWRWYGAIFAISAITGGLASFAWNPPGIVSVGASGGIVGLFAAALVVAFHYPGGALRTMMTLGAMRILLPTMLPFLRGRPAGPIDVAAHVGGAIGGAVIGLVILSLWSDDRRPARGVFAGIVTTAFAVCALASFAFAARDRAVALALTPNLPRDFQQQVRQSADLIKFYPRDPRVRYARAAALYDDDHNQEAKMLLEDTLADQAMLQVTPTIEAPVRQLLSMIDEADGDTASAKAVVAPLCGPTNTAFGAAKASVCK